MEAREASVVRHDPASGAGESSIGGVPSGALGVGVGVGGSSLGGAPGVGGGGSSLVGSAAAGAPGRVARATFDAGELAVVCSHYDIGVLESVREYRRGSGRAPKAVIKTDRGRYLLKRRGIGGDGLERVMYAHAMQEALAARRYPLPRLVRTRTSGSTMLVRGEQVYELFEFVAGEHYDNSLDATGDAGRALGFFHRLLGSFVYRRYQPSIGTYHGSGRMAEQMEVIGRRLPDGGLRPVLDRLRERYVEAGARVEELGYSQWPRQTIHGDWHPGNMLFRNARVVAVIDYDTARVAPRVVDIANGCLQFSITMLGSEVERWPANLDEGRFKRFCRGYESVKDQVISTVELAAVPWLMIEALIVEAAVPIAATGSFAGLDGPGFLRMVDEKSSWLAGHADRLVSLVAE